MVVEEIELYLSYPFSLLPSLIRLSWIWQIIIMFVSVAVSFKRFNETPHTDFHIHFQ